MMTTHLRRIPVSHALAMALIGCPLSACTTVDSISVSQIPAQSQRNAPIHAHDWSPIILLIPFGSGFINSARADLLSQCPDGDIEGTLAKFENVNYFLGLYETQDVTLDAYCVRGGNDAVRSKSHGRRKPRKT